MFDGLGTPGREADVVISAGRIVSVMRRATEQGTVEIDARGLAVAPGFIDIHSHGDGSLWQDPRAESLVRQGITTIVVGQDGSSRAPRVGSSAEDASTASTTFADLWTSIDRLRPAVNVASMIGLGTIRGLVVGGKDRPATADELARMVAMVQAARWRRRVRRVVGPRVHARRLRAARRVDRAVQTARRAAPAVRDAHAERRRPPARRHRRVDRRRAGRRVRITDLSSQDAGPAQLEQARRRVRAHRDARTAGCDAAFDRYPYIAYQTGLSNLFPVWSRDDSTDAFIARLSNAATADRIKQETLAKVELIGGWDNVLIASVSNAADRPAEGTRLGTYSSRTGSDPYATAVGYCSAIAATSGWSASR